MKIRIEVEVFLSALLSGIFLYAIYAAVEMLRKVKRHPLWLINLEDVCYWSVVLGYIFVQIYHTNNGIIRGYYVLGVVFGSVFMWKISSFFAKQWKKFVHFKPQKKIDK